MHPNNSNSARGEVRSASLRYGRLQWAVAALLLVLALLSGAPAARADAIVATNTPQALAAAMAQGGLVTFAQDGTITLTNTLLVTNQVGLDATGHTVTLSGNNAVQLFHVRTAQGSLSLTNLTLTGGHNTNGGALFVDTNATAVLSNCILTGNTAGAIFTNAPNVLPPTTNILASGATVLVTTNVFTNTFVFDPFSSFFLTNTFLSTQTSVTTNITFGIILYFPTNHLNVTNSFVSTNTFSFTNVVGSTNFTLTTNFFGTVLGTNVFIDTSTIVETNQSIITNLVIPPARTIATPGSNGSTGSDSSYGRGGSGGNGRAGQAALGGAIYNRGQLIVLNCLLATNSAIGGSGGSGGDGGSGAFKGGNGGAGGKGNDAFGGAVYNDRKGLVLIQNCTFDHNTATSGSGGSGGAAGGGSPNGLAGNGGAAGLAYGGALYNLGAVTNLASTFSFNQATGGDSAAAGTAGGGSGNSGARGGDAFGGAIYNASSKAGRGLPLGPGFLAFTNCTFYQNAVAGGKGGDGGPAESRAGKGGNGGNGAGGALFNTGSKTVFVIFCTFWQNSAAGGDKGVAGTGTFPNSDGSAGAAHGGDLARTSGTLLVANSIIGAAAAGRDIYGTIKDGGFNILSDKSFAFKKHGTSTNGVNPGLGSFGSFGGPTMTISLMTNTVVTNTVGTNIVGVVTNRSLAIDFVRTNTLVSTDQRGVARPLGQPSDAGAFEDPPNSIPYLLAMPKDLTPVYGSNATFSVSAAGLNLSYQWRFDATNIAGATGSTYTITNVTLAHQGAYDVVVTNSYGCVTSAPCATLTVLTNPPVITLGPAANRLVAAGSMVGFGVLATGSLPLCYQWFFNATNPLPGATSSMLILTNVSAVNEGAYTVVVTNLFGAVTSAPPSVLTIGLAPTITTPPASQAVRRGSNAVFSVSAQGTLPLVYQWRWNGTNLLDGCGPNLATLTLPNVQLTNAGAYSVLVTNPFGSITSAPATLSVLTAPVITAQPLSQTVLVGSNVTFQVTADGSQPLSYQWRYNQNPIDGAVTSSYVCLNAQTNNSGTYDVVISNRDGDITSSGAVLTVLTPVSLCGRLTDVTTAAGLGGLTVLLTSQVPSTNANAVTYVPTMLSTNTDAAGYYVFTNLWPGSSNTVTPAGACLLFQPASSNLVLTASSTNVDFVGLTNNVFAIQGQILNGLGGLSGLGGVSVQATNSSGSQTLVSDAAGYYVFSRLCPGTYQLIPSAPGYQFVPPTLPVTVGPNANQVSFAAVPVFTLGGRIVEGTSGAGLSGVTVLINSTNSVQTDTNGFFSQPNVPAGDYRLTPVLNCYRFAPAAALVTVGPAGPNQTNFVATNEGYQLGGHLTAGTNLLTGLTLKLVGQNVTNLVTTTNNFYVFPHVCPGTYLLEPQPYGAFQFNPASLVVAVGPDNTNLDFLVYGGFTASGRITLLATNGLPGVLVAAVGTDVASSATTDAAGSFRLLALSSGPQNIVPELAGYQFVPASRQVNLGADTNGLDFAALPVLSLASTNGGLAQVSFPVMPGVTYTLVASTNLLDWLTVFTTNLDYTNLASALVFQEPGSTQFPARFYKLGTPAAAPANHPALKP